MADLPVQPVLNYGQLLTSYGEGQAVQQNAQTASLTAHAQLPVTSAQAGLVGAQATGADIANQKAAMQLSAYQQYMKGLSQAQQPTADTSGVAPSDTGGGGGGDVFHDDATASTNMDQTYSQKYRVNAAYTPQETQSIQSAMNLAAATGDDTFVKVAQQQHDNRVLTQTHNSQNGAQQDADKMYALATADDPYAALKRINPEIAGHLATAHGLDPNKPETWSADDKKTLDTAVQKYSEMSHNALFQYTGDKLEDKNGITVNSRTGLKPIGDQTQGIAPAKWADLATEGSKIVDYTLNGAAAKVPAWQAAGAPSLAAWMRMQVSGGGGAKPGAAPGATPQPATSTKSAAAPAGGATPAATNGAAPAQDPVLQKALADPEYKYVPSPAPTLPPGVSRTPDQQKTLDDAAIAHIAARTELLKNAQDLTTSSAQALQYGKAAKAIMDGKGAPVTGLWAPAAAAISKFFPGGIDATNYQEASKYLGNLAVSNFKQNFGSKPANAEFQIQMHELNPSLKMQPAAISELLDANIRNMQYGIATGRRAGQYTSAQYNGDPQRFAEWNEKYYPREKIVNKQPGETPAAGPAALPKVGDIVKGYKYNGGPAHDPRSWSPAAASAQAPLGSTAPGPGGY